MLCALIELRRMAMRSVGLALYLSLLAAPVGCGVNYQTIDPIPKTPQTVHDGADKPAEKQKAPSSTPNPNGATNQNNQSGGTSPSPATPATPNRQVALQRNSANKILDSYYSQLKNYNAVAASVDSWFIPRFGSTSNSCV